MRRELSDHGAAPDGDAKSMLCPEALTITAVWHKLHGPTPELPVAKTYWTGQAEIKPKQVQTTRT